MKALPLLFLALTLAAPARAWQPGDHELLTMPTAWTMDQGSSYFTDYELFFLNYSYGVTPRTHVGVFTMFPIVSEFINTVSLGVKQNWLDGEKVDGALWGTYTPDGGMFTLGNVFSIGEPSKSLHVGACAVMGLNDSNNHTEWVGMVGYRGDLSEKGSLSITTAARCWTTASTAWSIWVTASACRRFRWTSAASVRWPIPATCSSCPT